MNLRHSAAAIILVLSFTVLVAADPFEDGVAAYESGNYATALRLFRPLANRGDARGQFSLGVIYNNGRGVAKDYIRAYMWLSLAAAQGDQTSAEYLDIVVRDMTPAQIAEARKLARLWKPANTRKGTPTKKSATQPTTQPLPPPSPQTPPPPPPPPPKQTPPAQNTAPPTKQ